MIASGTGGVGSTGFKVSFLLVACEPGLESVVRASASASPRQCGVPIVSWAHAVLELGAFQRDQVRDAGRDRDALGGQAAGAVRTAAPYRMFSATVTTRRFSGCSRNEPRTHSLNAPIAGPHQTW